MSKLSQNMMMVNEHGTNTNLPSAIFGSAATLPQNIARRPSLRIGLWPCISEDDPKTAMGLFAVLAHLIDQYPDVMVYRIFSRVDDDNLPESSELAIGDAQFGVDDWSVDDLDENIAVWGSYQEAADGVRFSVFWESDFDADEDDTHSLEFVASDLAALVLMLPQVAHDFLSEFGSTNGNS